MLAASVYVFFAVWDLRVLTHAHQWQFSESMPITRGMGYIFCIWCFLEIQLATKNIFEKIVAFTSAGVFVPPLMRLICEEFQFFPIPFFTSFYLGATLSVIASIAAIARTIELFIADHKASQPAS
jgi:hypothetical protein